MFKSKKEIIDAFNSGQLTEDEKIQAFKNFKAPPKIVVDTAPNVETAWMFLRKLNEVCSFQSREGKCYGPVSSSELKRWIQNKAFIINGETVDWDEPIDFQISSVVVFPNNPITLY